jgi:hypothetical protein
MEAQSAQPFISPVSSPRLLVPNNSPSYGFPAVERVQPHILNRALEATIPNAPQQVNTNGFVRPQHSTTRLRRSAGVPSLRPNRPRNNSQSQADEMNNAFFPSQSYEHSLENGSNYQGFWNQQPGYGQQAGSRSQIIYGQQNNFSQESAIVSSPTLLKEWNSDPKTGRRTCTPAAKAIFLSSDNFCPGCIIAACSSCVNHRAARIEPATYRASQKFSE